MSTVAVSKKLSWVVVVYFALIHIVGTAAAVFTFTWVGLIACVTLTVITGIAITLVYHRYLTHGGFKTYWWMRWLMTLVALLAGEGPPKRWVAYHRKHHALSDKEGDPHSPLDGFLHAHTWWMTYFRSRDEMKALYKRWIPDLEREWFMGFMEVTYFVWHFLFGGFLFWLGWYLWDTPTGWSLLVWGLFTRMFIVMHVTWSINSITHISGYRNYETTDQSRNNWLFGWLAFGEGWHNNHHAYPWLTWHGHKWWEFDLTGRIIWLGKITGLFRNVKDDVEGAVKRSQPE